MLPTGHEGPYSLDALMARADQGKIARDIKVWAEGLSNTLTLTELINRASGEETSFDDDLPPPLPPLAIDDEEGGVPDLPPMEEVEKSPKKKSLPFILIILFLGVAGFFGFEWFKEQEKFSIRRYNKMSVELHRKITNLFEFEGWSKKIFFREYVPADLSHIWLVTSGFQHCQVEAQFTSEKDKLLTLGNENVVFKSKGVLENHVVELSSFEFQEGSKIIPGLYQMTVTATECKWGGLLPKIGNGFVAPDETYNASMKVVLFSAGAEEFNKVLDQLIKKKMEVDLKKVSQSENFWQDLQQKYQTLLAISLQIEQLFLDFLDKNPATFSKNLKPTIDDYTKRFGHFLTNFVVANESYFNELEMTELRTLAISKNYEEMIRLTSKKVGFGSMKIIEKLQQYKKPPTPVEVTKLKNLVVSTFTDIKQNINQKLIEVTEDRSK